MTTLKANILLVRDKENIINHESIQVIALHYNNGYVVGCTALAARDIADFHGEDFEILQACYSWLS